MSRLSIMSRLMGFFLAAVLLVAAVPLHAEQAEEPTKFSLHSGVYASYGDYGANAHITYVYFPTTLKFYATPRLTLALTLPFLYQKNGSAATVEGVPVGVFPGIGATRRGATFGLGDMTATANYIFVEEKPDFPALSVYGAVKFPTADRNRALGTGEFDGSGGLAFRKNFDRNIVYGYAGYTVLGNPPGVNLKNFFSSGVGYARWVTSSFKPYIEFNFATQITEFSREYLNATLGFEYYFTRKISITAYAQKGIIAGAPDYAGGTLLNFYF
ncbi:MAG: DUF3187 family protein [Deltaproteobacteria bacterium]|nr:DUF3187 family protein [Deltaproteobacteria bacterium]